MAQDTPRSTPIPRSVTAERMLNSFLFVFVLHLIGSVLALIVLFQLIYSLVTMGPPIQRVTRFANRITRYSFEIFQYMTYNSEQSPFPFKELPVEEEGSMGHNATT